MSKQTQRGSEISVTLPTEPFAGEAKNKPVMAVMVQEDGVQVLNYEIPLGQSISFRVGGSFIAYMQRVGPAPDSEMFITANSGNKEEIKIEFEHALSGEQTVNLQAGQKYTINPVLSQHWTFSADNWDEPGKSSKGSHKEKFKPNFSL